MRVFARQRGDTTCSAPRFGAPDDKLRVLFVHTPTLPPLGADTWIHAQILANLDRETHELHAACATGPADRPTPTFRALCDIPDLHIRPVDFGRERFTRAGLAKALTIVGTLPAVFDLIGLARYIRRQRIAIIHTSDRPRDAFACVLLARLTGARSIVHAHVGFGEWMSPLLTYALRRADARIAVSEFVARTLTASGHDRGTTHVVLNAIDPAAWEPRAGGEQTRVELGIPDDAPVILTACRLFPSKGPGDLIRAVATVRLEHPDVRLVIAGKEMVAGFTAELATMASDLGVADNVAILGHRPDMPRLMAAADIFAMPSVGEPFGLVYLEAMAMELPVVALDSGGAPEVVEHGVTGLLSLPGDIRGLAANLSELLADPRRGAAMGHEGRRQVVSEFTSERMAADVAAVYRNVVGRTSRGTSTGGVGVRNLSVDQLSEIPHELDTHGYVVLRDVVSKESLTLLAKELTAAYEQADKFEGGGSITGHLNCFPGRHARFVYDDLTEAGIVDAVLHIRPNVSNAVRATMNYNLPGSVAQHYHIDGLYTDDFIICNVAVVDTTITNGAIDVVPGTNREFIPFWKYALHRTYRSSTRIEMSQGDVLLRKSNLWHRGMPNKSDVPRPMMSVTFGERSAPQSDPFDGDIVFYPNWYSTSRLGVLRERVFVAAPISYSAYRFVKSLHGNKGYSSY